MLSRVSQIPDVIKMVGGAQSEADVATHELELLEDALTEEREKLRHATHLCTGLELKRLDGDASSKVKVQLKLDTLMLLEVCL